MSLLTDAAPATEQPAMNGAERRAEATTGASREHLQATLISLVTILLSAANYGFSLVVVRWLSSADYVHYAAVQSLLLVLGTGCMAAVPWAIARHVALGAREAEGEALRFGLLASAVQGVFFALLGLVIVAPASGWAMAGVTSLAAFALSMVAAPLGVLQGQQRLEVIAGLRLGEAAVRIGLSLVLLVGVAASPTSPLIGFVAGSAVLFVAGMFACRSALPLRRTHSAALIGLIRQSLSLGLVQVLLAALGTIDTIVVGYTALADTDASSYQVAALLGRIPLYLASAVALSFYQGFARDDLPEVGVGLGRALRLFSLVGVPAAATVVGMPVLLLGILVPERAEQVSALLGPTVVIGLAVGLVTVLSAVHQARGWFRRALLAVAPVALLQPVALVVVGRGLGIEAFAVAGVVLSVAALVTLARDLRSVRVVSAFTRGEALGLALIAGLGVASRLEPWLWLLVLVGSAVAVLRAALHDVTRSPAHIHRRGRSRQPRHRAP